ncbi:hypothetical protein LLG46_11790 [bacterium]|nr:hypothetical protein [bacterium]
MDVIVKKKTWTIKRILMTVVLVIVTAFVMYIILGLSTFAYLTHSYNALCPGMTRIQVKSVLRGFSESQSSTEELSKCGRGVVKDSDSRVYRYDLFGFKWLDGPIYVIFDKRGRMDFAIDAYE